MRGRWCRGTAAALGALVLGAAAPAAAQAATTEPSTAWVRVSHLVPGLGAMTMTATLAPFDGGSEPVELVPSATYGAVSGYQALPPGYYAVSVRPAGSPADTSPVLTGTITATAGDAYTVAGIGTPTTASIEPIRDDLSAPGAGRAKVRVINATSTAGVDVTLADGTVLADDTAAFSADQYTAVPAGSLALAASAGGSSTSATTTTASNAIYTVLVMEDGKGGITLQQVEDASGAGVVPTGGAATGGGWASEALGHVDGAPLAAGGAMLAAAAAVLVVRRRDAAATAAAHRA